MEEILKEKPERILEITADKGYEQEEGRPNLLPGKCDLPPYKLRILYYELKADTASLRGGRNKKDFIQDRFWKIIKKSFQMHRKVEENLENIEKPSSIYGTVEDMVIV